MEKEAQKNKAEKKEVQAKDVVKSPRVVKKKNIFTAPLFVIAINIILLVLTFVILVNMPKKSDELKALKNQELDVIKSSGVQTSDLEVGTTAEKIVRLQSIFPDDTGIVNFVKEIEKLKDGGIVKGISFVSQEAVRDRTKALGIPFVIELEGSWADIDTTLTTIQKLPYLFRAITIETNINEEGIVNYKYGGFLYVDESLAKSR
jgi:hypothetical protein